MQNITINVHFLISRHLLLRYKKVDVRRYLLDDAELNSPGEPGMPTCIPEMYPEEDTGVAGGSVYDLGEEFCPRLYSSTPSPYPFSWPMAAS